MKLVQWIKEKYQHRRAGKEDHDPWWVTLMLDVGRPIVAVLILVMCAPGEHYLAKEAGWSQTLAWGMPGTLTAYAGIAAVVATKRPRGAPGRRTAVWGAIVSILMAMAAQPIAHLYGKVGLTPEQIALTVSAGLIPAAVFGHLLHMGAAAPRKMSTAPEVVVTPVVSAPKVKTPKISKRDRKAMSGVDLSGTAVVPDDRAPKYAATDGWRDALSEPVPDSPELPAWTAPDNVEAVRAHGHWGSPVRLSENGHADSRTAGQVSLSTDTLVVLDNPGQDKTPVSEPVRKPRSNVHSIKRSLSADVRAYLSEHPDAKDEDLAIAMAIKWPEKPWDSVRKARDRYQEKAAKEAGA